RKELIAANKSIEKIQQFLGVDKLLYQTEQDLVEAVTRKGKHNIKKPCMACLTGKYPIGKITEPVIRQL
ncbi:MAG: amidophosphoribosyltransferase, partial [Hydrotalea flava]|nr:amidophosphoribosyltransferase [Hydrotalea flava]NIO95509.1 amidophosphoribosyltransferase [Hydrotalea flava]